MNKSKASEIIKQECCGVGLLNIEKADLVKQVETLENDIILLNNQLVNAQKEILRLSK